MYLKVNFPSLLLPFLLFQGSDAHGTENKNVIENSVSYHSTVRSIPIIRDTLAFLEEDSPPQTMIIMNLDQVLTKGAAYTKHASHMETELTLFEQLTHLQSKGVIVLGLSNRTYDNNTIKYLDHLTGFKFSFYTHNCYQINNSGGVFYKGAILCNDTKNKGDILQQFLQQKYLYKKNVYVYDYKDSSVKDIVHSFSTNSQIEKVIGYVYNPDALTSLSMVELKSPRLMYRLSEWNDIDQTYSLSVEVKNTLMLDCENAEEQLNLCSTIESIFSHFNPHFLELQKNTLLSHKSVINLVQETGARWVVSTHEGDFIGYFSFLSMPVDDQINLPSNDNKQKVRCRKHKNLDFAIAIKPEHQGKKYGQEIFATFMNSVFQFTNAQSITYKCLKANKASCRLPEKSGFCPFEPKDGNQDQTVYYKSAL